MPPVFFLTASWRTFLNWNSFLFFKRVQFSKHTMKTSLSCTSLLSALWPWISSFSCQCCWLLQCRWQWKEQTFLSICLDMSHFIKEDLGLGGSWKILGNTTVRPLSMYSGCFEQDIESIDHLKGIIKSDIRALWFKVQRVLESNAQNKDFSRNARIWYPTQDRVTLHYCVSVLFLGVNCSKSRAFFPNPLGLCSSPPEMLSSMLRVAEHWTRSFDRWVLTRSWAWCMWCMIFIYLHDMVVTRVEHNAERRGWESFASSLMFLMSPMSLGPVGKKCSS